MPVVVADLHSALPAVLVGVLATDPDLRVAYVMTDGGALPAGVLPDPGRAGRRRWPAWSPWARPSAATWRRSPCTPGCWPPGTCCGADVAVVTQGPGNLGTGTPVGLLRGGRRGGLQRRARAGRAGRRRAADLRRRPAPAAPRGVPPLADRVRPGGAGRGHAGARRAGSRRSSARRSTRTWPGSPTATRWCGWTPTAWTTRCAPLPRRRCRRWAAAGRRPERAYFLAAAAAGTHAALRRAGGTPRGRSRAPALICFSADQGRPRLRGPSRRHMQAMSFSTRSSTDLNGSLHSTVRWAWSLSLRCTQSTVKSRRLLLRLADELAAQPGPGGLRRHVLGLEDARLVGHPVDLAGPLEQVVQAAGAADVVVGEVHLGDPRGATAAGRAWPGSARSG